MINVVLLVIITTFIPPIGVFLVAGCGADLLINILLTILGYFPGHIHAFYIEYQFYKRRERAQQGVVDQRPAPGVYSAKVNNQVPASATTGAMGAPAQQGQYGTIGTQQPTAQYGVVGGPK